jgi:hypothetical protein
MGRADIRELPLAGAISAVRRVVGKGGSLSRGLAALVARTPEGVAAGALANGARREATGSGPSRAARMIRAVTTKQGDCPIA